MVLIGWLKREKGRFLVAVVREYYQMDEEKLTLWRSEAAVHSHTKPAERVVRFADVVAIDLVQFAKFPHAIRIRLAKETLVFGADDDTDRQRVFQYIANQVQLLAHAEAISDRDSCDRDHDGDDHDATVRV